GRAASGKGYPHRRRFLLGRSPAAGTGPFLCLAAVLPPRAPDVRGTRTVRLEITPSLRFWVEKAIFSRPSQLRALCVQLGPLADRDLCARGSIRARARSKPWRTMVGMSEDPP